MRMFHAYHQSHLRAGRMLARHFQWVCVAFIWLMLTAVAFAADGGPLSTAEPATYSGPITISSGGTYSGNWKSTSDNVPAVYITTTDPVIIEYSHLSSTGHLISAPTQVLNLTVRNSSFHGHAPTVSTHFRGDAIRASGYRNLMVENNYFENTGIVVQTDEYSGDGTAQNTLTVRYNQVRNIIGLSASGSRQLVQFVAVQNYRQPSGNPKNAEIAWNDVINTPGSSCSEDLINFFKGGGRVDGWFKVHDNYLQGSYPAHPATDSATGSAIIIDGPDHNRAAYIEAYNNFAINTTNAGMNVAAGSNIWYHGNRIISTGKLPDGTWMPGSYGGVGIFDFYAGDAEYTGTMHDIVVENNVVGWAKQNLNNPYPNRNDNAVNLNGAYKSTNVSLPDAPITQAMQDQEYQTFLQRVKAAGILMGPRAIAVPNTPPTITPINARTISQNASTGAILFTVGDAETAAGSLTVTGSSTNTTLVPTASILLAGSDANRTVSLTPAANQSGSAVIALTVNDGTTTTSASFTLTVNDPSIVFVSDLTWTGTAQNGWGPPEKDRSNGEQGAADGNSIKLRGTTYIKGLGVHAYSELVYAINGNYSAFHSDIGIDDESAGNGSVDFQVWADGAKLFDSGTLLGTSAVRSVDVNLIGKSQLKLIVAAVGASTSNDHADWAGALLISTAFSRWQQSHFTTVALNDPAISGPAADPNGNGIPNLVEYYFGLDPLSSTMMGSLLVSNGTADTLTMTYRRNTAATDVNGVVEQSSDLINWSNNGVTDSLITDGAIQTRRASVSKAGSSRKCLRIHVIK